MKFRYDINALRAIAVLGVVFFHYEVPYLKGGFSGVDIFFVISGYLMSKIIISSINKGSFSFADFYSKRVKRIVPALLFLVLTVSVAGFFIFFPDDYVSNEQNGLSSILFLSNIFYWKNSEYFALSSQNNIFLHTWSLAVEWQFYLIYPVLLLLLTKVCKTPMAYLTAFIALTLVLFLGTAVFAVPHANTAFYWLPTRAWEMLFGGVAFLLEGKLQSLTIRKYMAICGYIALLLCFLLLKSEMTWPGAYTFIPVFFTFLIILANFNDFKLLKTKAVQLIGKTSYSFYLWHWPVYVTFIYIGIEMNAVNIAASVLFSFLLGYISYRYIESMEFKSSKAPLLAGACLVVLTTVLSFVVVNKVAFKPDAVKVAGYYKAHKAAFDQQLSVDKCFLTTGDFKAKDFDSGNCLTILAGKKIYC